MELLYSHAQKISKKFNGVVSSWKALQIYAPILLSLLSRLSSESLTALEIPNDMLQIIQDLILDLRVRCIIVTLQHTAEGKRRLQVSLLTVFFGFFCLWLGWTMFWKTTMFVADIVVVVDSSDFCNISQELLKYFTLLTEMSESFP